MTEAIDVQMTFDRYEAALLERLTQQFPPLFFEVHGTRGSKRHHVVGRYSAHTRQLDAAVYRREEEALIFVADAKCHRRRKIGVPQVECFMGLMDDVGCRFGLIASPLGFTAPAERRAKHARLELMVMTFAQALQAEWLPIARRIYPFDWAFHSELASALLAIDQGDDPESVAERLQDVPFEEWQGFLKYGLSHHPAEASRFLKHVAKYHRDDAWRFNAVDLLLDHQLLDAETRATIRRTERDPEVLELLTAAHS